MKPLEFKSAPCDALDLHPHFYKCHVCSMLHSACSNQEKQFVFTFIFQLVVMETKQPDAEWQIKEDKKVVGGSTFYNGGLTRNSNSK